MTVSSSTGGSRKCNVSLCYYNVDGKPRTSSHSYLGNAADSVGYVSNRYGWDIDRIYSYIF